MASLDQSVGSGRPKAAVLCCSLKYPGLAAAFAVVAFAAFAFGAVATGTFAASTRAFLFRLHGGRVCFACTGFRVHLEVS